MAHMIIAVMRALFRCDDDIKLTYAPPASISAQRGEEDDFSQRVYFCRFLAPVKLSRWPDGLTNDGFLPAPRHSDEADAFQPARRGRFLNAARYFACSRCGFLSRRR